MQSSFYTAVKSFGPKMPVTNQGIDAIELAIRLPDGACQNDAVDPILVRADHLFEGCVPKHFDLGIVEGALGHDLAGSQLVATTEV